MHVIDWLALIIPLTFVIIIAARTYGHTKSVSDFMAAGRVAGRYLLTNAVSEAGGGIVGQLAAFQMIFVAGFVVTWWSLMSTPVSLFIVLTGYVMYRYRQSRVLTMAQFFEIRYSKSFRIFSGALIVLSGVLNFAIFPATSARFFVYFCGLPETTHIGSLAVPTFALLMGLLLSMTLTLTVIGGWLTVMVVDCVEGLISGVLYLVVIGVLLYMFSWGQISQTMSAAPPGHSLLNPFDAAQVKDFNLWYVVIGLIVMVYGVGSWQGGSGFRAAALSPHESKMAGVIGVWRGQAKALMFTLLAVCAFTYLRHADFAMQSQEATAYLKTIQSDQIRSQMEAPVALAYLLPIGIKGILAAIMLFAMMAGEGAYMHSWGGIFIQDIILPFRTKPFEPKQHIRLLRLAILGVAIFAFCFGLLYTQTDYLYMYFSLTGAIFAGAGAVIVGGLYWNRGTTAAAWSAVIAGAVVAVGSIALKMEGVWPNHVAPWLLQYFPDSAYLKSNMDKFPVNGQLMSFGAVICSVTTYVVVSLLTCREKFNMDRMLHRGAYAVEAKQGEVTEQKSKFSLASLVGITAEFTRGDKILSILLFSWTMFWFLVFVVVTVWNLIAPWPTAWWAIYWHVYLILLPLAVGSLTTIWFTWGGLRDLRRAFTALKTAKRDARDDGMVVNHRNLDDENGGSVEKASSGANTPASGPIEQPK